MNENISIGTMPILALRGLVVFPEQTVHFEVGRVKSVLALEEAMKGDQTILLIPQKAMLFAAHPATVACGIAGGVLFVLSLVCMQTSISVSGAILTSAFSKLGLIVPIALSIFLFHEMPTLLQGAGLLIVLCAFLVMNRSSGPDRPQEFHLMSLLIVLLTINWKLALITCFPIPLILCSGIVFSKKMVYT